MAKKKLQLSELKVKSFVTVVQPAEQKTAKGGYRHLQTVGRIIRDISGISFWTQEKTFVNINNNPSRFGGPTGGSNSFTGRSSSDLL